MIFRITSSVSHVIPHDIPISDICLIPRDGGKPQKMNQNQNQKIYATGSSNGEILLFTSSGKERPVRLSGHIGEVTSVSCSPHGNLLVSAGADKSIRFWDTDSLSCDQSEHVLKGCHQSKINELMWTRGDLLISCSDDKSAKIWRLDFECRDYLNKKRVSFETSLVGHTNSVKSVRQHEGNEHLVITGSSDKTLRTWDSEYTHKCVRVYTECDAEITRVRYQNTNSENILVAGTSTGNIFVFDTRMDRNVQRYSNAHDGPILSLTPGIGSLSSTVFSGSTSNMKAWDLRHGRCIYQETTHSAVRGILIYQNKLIVGLERSEILISDYDIGVIQTPISKDEDEDDCHLRNQIDILRKSLLLVADRVRILEKTAEEIEMHIMN